MANIFHITKTNELHECPICSSNNTNLTCTNTKNAVGCYDCVSSWITQKINENGRTQIPCTDPQCKEFLSRDELFEYVTQETKVKYDESLMMETFRSEIARCPMKDCDGIGMLDKLAESSFFECPKCSIKSCHQCKVEFHVSFTCKQYQSWKLEMNDEDAKSNKWKNENTKPCPQCKSPIEKKDGCSHVLCVTCNVEFCYECLQKYTPGHIRDFHPDLWRQINPNAAITGPILLVQLRMAQAHQMRLMNPNAPPETHGLASSSINNVSPAIQATANSFATTTDAPNETSASLQPTVTQTDALNGIRKRPTPFTLPSKKRFIELGDGFYLIGEKDLVAISNMFHEK